MTAPPALEAPLTPQDRFWKSQPGDVAHACVDAVLAAETIGEAISVMVDALPDWTISRCTRYARAIWNRREEHVARSVLYAMLPAALTDGGFRSRAGGLQSRPTESRAVHNAHVKSGAPL